LGAGGQPVVYVVDDDDAVRDSLKALIEAHGIAVEDYASTAEFLGAPRPRREGCLLLDLHLPGTSGLDFLAAHRDLPQQLPVIMFTGRGDAQSRARAERLGVSDYLDKPVREQVLLASIRRALAES
jgi:FixJ family two-component response regulator